MSFLKTLPLWKLVLLLIPIFFAPHSLKDSLEHVFPHIDAYFFLSLLIMGLAISFSWLAIKYYWSNGETLFHKYLLITANRIWQSPPLFTILFCCLFVAILVPLVSVLIYESVPRVADEIAQLFQSKIFLTRKLSAPAPPLPEFFTYAEDNMIISPKWYSQYPPGFPLLLSIGSLLGSPWIINPILAALTVLIIFVLCRELFDHTTAVLSAVLFALSPKVIFTSASLMNHTAAMFFMLLSITAVLFALKKNKALLALCSGLSLGMCLNIRTLEAVVLFLPIGIYSVIICLRNRTAWLRMLSMWFCGFGIMAGILLWYNYQTTGSPMVFGYVVRWGGESHQLGFHTIRGGSLHTPYKGFINSLRLIRLTDKSLFEWPLPATFFILSLFLFVRTTLWDWIFLSIIFLNIGIYFFWGWYDPLFMGRFYFTSIPYLIILVARGVLCFTQLFSINYETLANSQFRAQPLAAPALIVVLLFFLIAIPTRAADIVSEYKRQDLQVDQRLQKAVEEKQVHNAIVFIEPQDKHELIVGGGFFMNTPDLAKQDIIFAKDLGQNNKRLLEVYTGRNGFLYRHRKDVKKTYEGEYCVSPSEAFELVPISE